jgi:hypothetical protein
MTPNKTILLTGSHRSGSSWAGRMIAASPMVGLIYEPFNIKSNIRQRNGCSAKFEHWFTYLCEENEQDFYQSIKKTINFHCSLLDQLKTARAPRELARSFKYYMQFQWYQVSRVRPLLKDPIAIFSAEWLARKFDIDVIVLIRHPAAFAGSLKVKNWTHPFDHFLKQPLLMRDLLYPFEDEIRKFVNEEQDIIDQAALLWKLIYYVVSIYKQRNSQWIFIRHEDLSIDPVEGFRSLYQDLDLEFSQSIAEFIRSYSYSEDHEDSGDINFFRRDSISNISTWKTRLTNAEVKRIKGMVDEVSAEYYSDDDWE